MEPSRLVIDNGGVNIEITCMNLVSIKSQFPTKIDILF